MKPLFFMTLLCLTVTAMANTPQEISVPKNLLSQLKSFESSAAVYLPATNNFLISSDDTTEDDAPMLFLMDNLGRVNKTPVMITGVSEMTDIESLITNKGYIYAMSSQSRNKKGKVIKARNLFVRGKLSGMEIKDTQVIELRGELLKVLAATSDVRIQTLQTTFDKMIEIEASFIKNGSLFVGLKDSQSRAGLGMVLELGPVDEIFSTGKLAPLKVKVAAELDFTKAGGTDEKISDIALTSEGDLLVTATLENGGGSVWKYDGKTLVNIQFYTTEKPEGIACLSNGESMVVYDQGDEPSLFSYLKY